ncbi:MAG TPA: hypothetical protein VFQ92_01890 [Blastocatellia bacterium]|nr:hypothetical protein [Blastocatellia bacterium]
MDLRLVDRIVNAVLYEGYMLYPYRPSAVKNRQRWNFGVLYPESYSAAQGAADASSMQTECLITVDEHAALDVRARFLHLLAREIGVLIADAPAGDWNDARFRVVESLDVDGQVFQTWQEAVERDVSVTGLSLSGLAAEPQRVSFSFPSSRNAEPLKDEGGRVVGVMVRTHQAIEGAVELSAERVDGQAIKVTARIVNLTPLDDAKEGARDEALMRSLISTHTILGVCGGEFVSLLDPPLQFREAAGRCQNIGTWPVLLGSEAERDAMLSSPIILYDYPQVAPESAGDFFDGTEIDEMLALRVMTLTEEEKREMRDADERTRRILEMTETLPAEQMMKLHGAVRGLRRAKGESR